MRYLVVDAHSVIFAWPDLRALHARRMILAREALVARLTGYQDASGIRVVAVFDGKGAKLSDESTAGGIQIFYSAAGQSADMIVERLAATYAGHHEVTVVTNDHLEQQTAITFGALAISAEEFRGRMEEAGREMAERVKQWNRRR